MWYVGINGSHISQRCREYAREEGDVKLVSSPFTWASDICRNLHLGVRHLISPTWLEEV